MPAKLITFTANHLSPNKLFSTFKIHIDCKVNVSFTQQLTITEDTWQHVSPVALAVTTTSVCSEPEDGLAPGSDHRSISPLFFSQTPSWHQAILVSRLSFKLSCWAVTLPHKIPAVISIVSCKGNIGILLWISWRNLTNKQTTCTSVNRGFCFSYHCDVVSNNNTPSTVCHRMSKTLFMPVKLYVAIYDLILFTYYSNISWKWKVFVKEFEILFNVFVFKYFSS